MYKYSFHRKNDSGELDVFEAAQYFSSAINDQSPWNFNNAEKFSHREERQQQGQRAARMSLDSLMRDSIISQNLAKDSSLIKENRKCRQPSSPGGRLACFLSSLFNKTRSKKRRSQAVRENESPDERRERRSSSISHFRVISGTNKNVDSLSNTPTKSGSDFRFRDLLDPNSLSCSEKQRRDNAWIDEYTSEEREFRKFSDCEDGTADTDSSSDLFDLPNCEFEFYPNDLPVYETTRINVRRASPL